jgi:hypothetical protein
MPEAVGKEAIPPFCHRLQERSDSGFFLDHSVALLARCADHFLTVTPMSASLQVSNSAGSLNQTFSFDVTSLQ